MTDRLLTAGGSSTFEERSWTDRHRTAAASAVAHAVPLSAQAAIRSARARAFMLRQLIYLNPRTKRLELIDYVQSSRRGELIGDALGV